MNVVDFVSIGVFILSVISSIISILVSKFKNKNKLEEYKSKAERAKKVVELVSEIIPKAVSTAEKTGTMGNNKKLIALSQILIECMNNNIDYSSVAENIDKTIEDLIKFSKEVNCIQKHNRGVNYD